MLTLPKLKDWRQDIRDRFSSTRYWLTSTSTRSRDSYARRCQRGRL